MTGATGVVRVSKGQSDGQGVSTSTSRRLVHLRSSADGAQLRTGTMYGTQYIVVPCVSKLGNNVEFPVNAPTPEYIPAHVLAFLTESRNNRPVVMGHPQVNGEYVSANAPDILDTYSYGYMYGAQFVDGEVRCDLWLDPVRAALVDGAAQVIERLQAGETVEVSEGDYVIVREESGEYNGKAYGGVWEFCASDHLATLREDEVGACSVADGCGALRGSLNVRSSVLSVARTLDGQVGSVAGMPTLRTSALSQARRPTFTGTETGTWSKPTFADYVRYLFNGDTPPTSVSQCSAELKRSIAAHTLLGDPDAGNFSDLSFFPVVNPSTGKLNENALRAVISGRGSSADIAESALTSAQDMATRLLNSEFSANLETSTTTSEVDPVKIKKESNAVKRLLGSMFNALRSAMSNNELRQKLSSALADTVRGFSYVYDEDPDAKTVKYCVVIRYGEYYSYDDYDYFFFQRTYTLDANNNPILNDDPVQIEPSDDGWRVVVKTEPKPDDVIVIVSEDNPKPQIPPTTLQPPCACRGESTMDVTARTAIISRLCALATGPFKGQEAGLQAMSAETLTALDKAYPDGTATPPAQATTVQPAQAGGSGLDPDGGQPVTPTPAVETVSIPKDEYETIKASAAAFQRSQEERKTRLVTALKTAQTEFTEADLKAMSAEQVDRLARAFKVDVSGAGSDPSDTRFDYSGARPAVGASTRRRTPDTYGLRAAEEKKNAAKTAPN